ncbi:MAG: hypothetical protein EA341_15820 [Mongoliibacter sp.]|uniref:sensor histidine kinase n=1 Tax=Mongoliibacter sp. TaxID=2022438 RepID=UPI0012F394E0|nr:ATP-binding protein [Mongoliibacter sp.]TVP44969.1 MAG: hypothetical protein EA341_15820 [Mongoliibacter sp.]
MHTIKNTISLLFTFLWITIPGFLSAQSALEEAGRLPISTYLPEKYKGAYQVWSAIQSEDGLMYFGTSNGLIEYDGVNWRNVFGENDSRNHVRYLAKDKKGRIFYAGTDAYGYLERDAKGETQPVSFLHLIPEEYLPLGTIWTIQLKDNYIYLQARDKILRLELSLDLELKSLKNWKAETAFMYSFLLDDTLFIHQIEKGLYKLKGEDIVLIPGTEALGRERLTVMLPYGNDNSKQYLLGHINAGFYLWDGELLQKFPSQVDPYLKGGSQLYKGELLDNGDYALSLLGGGFLIMNSIGEVIRTINKSNGLQADNVISAYEDLSGGLWLTTDKGMARVEINTPALLYGEEIGISSSVNAIEKIGDDLFVGTTNGLLKFNEKEKTFQPAPGTNTGQLLDLLKDGEDLIIPGNQFQILRAGKIIPLENPKNRSFPNVLFIQKNNPNILYVGHGSGVAVYSRGLLPEVPWEYLGEIEGVDRDIYYLRENREGELWAGTRSGFTFQVSKQENNLGGTDLNAYKVKSFQIENGSGWISAVNGEIYAQSYSGLQRFSKADGEFIKATEFDQIEANIIGIIEDPLKRVWVGTKSNEPILLIQNPDGTYEKNSNQGSMGQYLPSNNFLDADSSMWFVSSEGLIRYDPKKEVSTEKPFFTLLRRIETKTDTLELIRYGRDQGLEAIRLKDNSYRFEFAAPYFEEEKKTKYQTFLEGFDPDWVDWNDNKVKEYTNLPPAKYRFRVRAQNAVGKISEEAVFAFTVLPPWYATWWAYLIYFMILALIIFGIVKFQSERLLAKERERAREKELAQAKEIEKAYHKLKSTQAQLIQSEKMASLGELTAGIAHEIQNPLNFVNNFSEVSAELVEEIREARSERREAKGGMRDENDEMEDEILEDIKQNLEKIQHHGKRADAIVKGMLEHSKSGSGEKELTNLNTLAKEYLNLAYQGFKAKNKDGEIQLITDFDSSLPKIEIVRSDIGKVLLNIVINAFQATNEPSKGLKPLEGFKPFVTVSTKNLGDKIQISISDNGPGIPEAIRDKIFQPFFTTKPAGQGTGLGLSLSYDIIKAHGGEISVESSEGKGTEFIIQIPLV